MENSRPIWHNSRLWSLGIGEMLVWAAIFYVFPAMLLRWSDHFGWSIAEISVAFTLALASSAIAGIAAGRIIDKGHSRILFTLSVCAGALLISVIPYVGSILAFYCIWVLIGIAMAGCLYEPCFSYITRTYKNNSKNAIVFITLQAGFASSVSYSVSTILSDAIGWDNTLHLFSLTLIFVTAPLFWYGSPETNRQVPDQETGEATHDIQSLTVTPFLDTVIPLIKNPVFWLIFITFAAFAATQGMFVSQIFPLLQSKGISDSTAVILASLIGPMQVLARFILFLAEYFSSRDIPATKIATLCLIAFAGTSVLLLFGNEKLLMVLIFVTIQGGMYGLVSIVRPVLTSDSLGTRNFGVIFSLTSMGFVWGFAVAPAIAGWIAEIWSYDAVLITTTFVSILGLISLSFSKRFQKMDVKSGI